MSLYLEHTATVRVTTPTLVRCIHCQTAYIYEFTQAGYGYAESGLIFGKRSAKNAAMTEAQEALRRKMERPGGCAPVPCPGCLRFQPYMRETAARRKYRQVQALAWTCFVFVLILGCFMVPIVTLPTGDHERRVLPNLVALGGGVSLLGVVILLIHAHLVARYDPNNMLEWSRKLICSQRAMRPERFQEIQQRRTEESFRGFNQAISRLKVPDEKVRRFPPFILDVWVTPAFLASEGALTVVSPMGHSSTLDIRPGIAAGDVYPLPATPLHPVKFAVRLRPFHPCDDRDDSWIPNVFSTVPGDFESADRS
ncbi:unnamed protein product [Gemmataceae bacterium]|nr:unnamed protein product [Gemmataceae bacterium]VTT97858.1 unnamed protein product [Gemmataceae bacterium]